MEDHKKHTPLPWKFDVKANMLSGKCEMVVFHEFDHGFESVATIRKDEKDAEFIIRACNMHYELLEALKELVGEYKNGYGFVNDRGVIKLYMNKSTWEIAENLISKSERE